MAERDPSPDGTERDVLASLPRTRPARRSAKRGAPASAATAAPQEATKASGRPVARRPPRRRPAPAPPAPPVPPAGYATPRAQPADGDRRHPGLLGTAVQAAGELAQLGLTVGTQALKGALGRLPRP